MWLGIAVCEVWVALASRRVYYLAMLPLRTVANPLPLPLATSLAVPVGHCGDGNARSYGGGGTPLPEWAAAQSSSI